MHESNEHPKFIPSEFDSSAGFVRKANRPTPSDLKYLNLLMRKVMNEF